MLMESEDAIDLEALLEQHDGPTGAAAEIIAMEEGRDVDEVKTELEEMKNGE